MPDLQLSFAMTAYDRVMPIINGEVKPDGIELEYKGMPGAVPRVFYEQIKYHRYDVSEMSISSYLRMRPEGFPYRMLPVFHNRNFSYVQIAIRKASGIREDHPEDLKGKRFGINDFQQSRGLWVRGILKLEWGIEQEDMVWFQERGEHFSHTGSSVEAGLSLPPNLSLSYAKTDFGTMLLAGELDAVGRLVGLVSGIDRKRVDVTNDPQFTTLFSDPVAEAMRFYKKHGVYPPHHITVVRESILKEHPWIAMSLMEAFNQAKEIAIRRLREQRPPTLMVFGEQWQPQLDEVFGRDPYPHGVKANAKALDMAQTYSVEQGLSARKMPLDEMFPEEIIYSEERL